MFRRAGIRNYSIWQAGDTLFGYYECDDLQTALVVQQDAPVSARWRTYMRDVIRMERDPKSGAQTHLEQVFFFGCDTFLKGSLRLYNAGPAEGVWPGAPLDASQLVVESL